MIYQICNTLDWSSSYSILSTVTCLSFVPFHDSKNDVYTPYTVLMAYGTSYFTTRKRLKTRLPETSLDSSFENWNLVE